MPRMGQMRGGLVSSIAATAIGPDVASPPPAGPELGPGTLVDDRYRIEAVLGRGGMGVVYRAEQLAMQRPVALKMLRDVLAGSEMMTVRFRREALAASRVRSPHVVTLHDFGVTGDGAHLYLVMELLEGEPLSDRLEREGRLPPDIAVSMARQIATALAAAHEAGVVHRDLKPENVLVQPDGHLKVVDFGIARIYEHDGASSLSVTDTNTIVGTPLYMSPETVARRPIGPASDLYSLGVMLFEMLTGRAPFEETEAVLLMSAHLITPAPRLRDVAPEVALPAQLELLVSRLLAKAPNARPASAREVIGELDAISWDAPTSFADRTGPIRLPVASASGRRGPRVEPAAAEPAAAEPAELAPPAKALPEKPLPEKALPEKAPSESVAPSPEPTSGRDEALAPSAHEAEPEGEDAPVIAARSAPAARRSVVLGFAALLVVALTTGGAAWWLWPSRQVPVASPDGTHTATIDSTPVSAAVAPIELADEPADRPPDLAPTTEAAAQPPRAAAEPVRITFDVAPAEATLILDGRPLASRTIDLPADDATLHTLVATAPGHRRAELTFAADATRTLEVRLAPERRRPRTDRPPGDRSPSDGPPAGQPTWNQLRGW